MNVIANALYAFDERLCALWARCPSTAWTLAALAVVAELVALGVITGIVHIDLLPALHTYGLSAGTSTRYCFADLVRWHLSAGCEAAS